MTRNFNEHLSLEGVGVTYGNVRALPPLSLKINSCEFFCLLGPSGCGKTTTLNVIAGFIATDSGRVLLDGRDITRLPPQKRQIGVVFQNYALFPHMTAADNIAYGLKLQKVPSADIDRQVAGLLELVQLENKGGRYPKNLSGGEQQRVAIARALAIKPQLLLLDEPLSNLDARLRDEMRTELKRIQRLTGVTTVFVTHDQQEAFTAGDRIAVLNKGIVEQVGTPTEIYERPASHFVARFIGRSNEIRGSFNKGDGAIVVGTPDNSPAVRALGWQVSQLAPPSAAISRTRSCFCAPKPCNSAISRATPMPLKARSRTLFTAVRRLNTG